MNTVETQVSGRVMTITLADVENRNALGVGLLTELIAALDRADTDPDVRVVVLTNRGPVFCAGVDLAERTSSRGSSGPDPVELFSRFRHSPKPYIGRIAGHCVAGGMGLAAAMDIALAVEDARFGFTEVRVGVAPAMISVLCLPKLSAADASAAFLRGNRFPAREAARMGLINASVPADHLDEEIDAIVADVLAGGPNAIAATKQLLARVPGMSVEEAFRWTADVSAELFKTDEAAEGMTAFLEKRRPRWAGDS